MVECVEPPHGWLRGHIVAQELGPFVMHLTSEETNNRDCSPHVRYINGHRVTGGDALRANTHISKEGNFIVRAAKAGDELLCSYGHGFDPSAQSGTLVAEATSHRKPQGARKVTATARTRDTSTKGTACMSRQEGIRCPNEYYSE